MHVKNCLKRLFDFIISLIVLILIGWFLIIIAIWLHIANKGAGAFFFQPRPGKNGKVFKVIKYKTMTDERDENGKLLPDAKRLTKVGKFVRSTSIDELPQLINVLKGDMALIGPRPLYVRYMPYYTEEEQRRHEVRPGISEESAHRYGRYCVQYLTFRNDNDGLSALMWWKESCIEWCYQIMEPNRYADQKYLDEFPKRWHNAYVLRNKGAGIAPWNMHRYKYNDNFLIYDGIKYTPVFFHMHGVLVSVDNRILIAQSIHHALDPDVKRLFYEPYAALMVEVFTKYLGQKIDKFKVNDMPFLKKIEYKIRSLVRRNEFLTNFYFNHFKKGEIGHGTLINS